MYTVCRVGKVLDTDENMPQLFLTRLLRRSDGDMLVCVYMIQFFCYFASIFDVVS